MVGMETLSFQIISGGTHPIDFFAKFAKPNTLKKHIHMIGIKSSSDIFSINSVASAADAFAPREGSTPSPMA